MKNARWHRDLLKCYKEMYRHLGNARGAMAKAQFYQEQHNVPVTEVDHLLKVVIDDLNELYKAHWEKEPPVKVINE